MKTLTLTLVSTLLLVACGDGNASTEDTGSSTGGETDDPTGGKSNSSAPDPTTPTGPTSDSEGESSEGGEAGSTEGGEESSSEGGETEGPVDLPFGGHVQWTVQSLIAYGSADFYELPDDETYEPSDDEAPLGEPVSEDGWRDLVNPPPPMPGKPFEFPALDVGPQLFVDDAGGASFTFEYSEGLGYWDMGLQDLEAPYAGGEWSVEIPGNARFPAETFENVLVAQATGASQLEIVRDENSVPSQLSWTPLDGAHNAYAFVVALGPAGDFLPLCDAMLADDGEAEIPDNCVGLDGVPLDPETFDTFLIVFGHAFEADVEYAEHRVRFSVNVAEQYDMPYPFEG